MPRKTRIGAIKMGTDASIARHEPRRVWPFFCPATLVSALLVALVLGAFSLTGIALADPPPHSHGGGGDGDDGAGNLEAKFCVTFADFPGDEVTPPDRIQSDFDLNGSDTYCDSKRDKILAFTGKGPGFRFDTNASGKFGAGRTVFLDFGIGSGYAEIDMRFIRTEGGLDLGALAIPQPGTVPGTASTGTVSLRIVFSGKTLGDGLLTFGPVSGDPEPWPGCAGSNEVTVTRWDKFTWTIESFPEDIACLNSLTSPYEEIGRFHMPFQITLVDMESPGL